MRGLFARLSSDITPQIFLISSESWPKPSVPSRFNIAVSCGPVRWPKIWVTARNAAGLSVELLIAVAIVVNWSY